MALLFTAWGGDTAEIVGDHDRWKRVSERLESFQRMFVVYGRVISSW